MSLGVRSIIRKCCSNSRNFSRSCMRKDAEKKVPQASEQKEIDQSHIPPIAMRLVEPKDRLWLYFGSKGKYKSREEIPKHVPISEIMAAQNRVRIKVSNYLMGFFLIAFFAVSYKAKQDRAKGAPSIQQQGYQRILQWQEEGRKEREAAALASSSTSSATK